MESKAGGTAHARSRSSKGGTSSEESLIDRIRTEFEAPVGLLDPKSAGWRARDGLEPSEFPSPDACLTAALAAGLPYHGGVAVWRPGRDQGPWWLCLPIALRNGADLLAIVGFADRDEAPIDSIRRAPVTNGEAPRRWGMPCPERALRAWGQSFANELKGEVFPRANKATARQEGGERLLVARLIRRMKMSDAPVQFQDLALRAVKGTLGVAAAAWIPSNPREQVCVAGEIDGFDELDFRSLVPNDMPGGVRIENRPDGDELPGLRKYVVVAAETQSTSGWLVALNPLEDADFGQDHVELLQPIASLIGNQRMNWRNFRELKDMLIGIIRSLTTAIDAKDPYTKGHSQRVARIAVRLAEVLRLPPTQRGDIYLMGLLHDVGKIGIKDEVLKKRGDLTAEERAEIRKHVTIGVEILSDLKKLQHVLPAVLHHHEAWDGSGYPAGLKGEAIPLEARILAVADSFDAMASDRPYRKGLPSFKIDTNFREGAGKQWDARIVEALFACRNDVAEITDRGFGNSIDIAIQTAMTQGSSEAKSSTVNPSRDREDRETAPRDKH